MRIYTVYSDFLDYVLANPDAIATTSFFQKMSLISFISYINSFAAFRDINFKIAPLRIDMGNHCFFMYHDIKLDCFPTGFQSK